MAVHAAQPGHRAQQGLGVGMLRFAQYIERHPLLHQPARVHDVEAMGGPGHQGQVVGDQQEGHAELALQRNQKLHDLRLHGNIQGCGGLVGN